MAEMDGEPTPAAAWLALGRASSASLGRFAIGSDEVPLSTSVMARLRCAIGRTQSLCASARRTRARAGEEESSVEFESAAGAARARLAAQRRARAPRARAGIMRDMRTHMPARAAAACMRIWLAGALGSAIAIVA